MELLSIIVPVYNTEEYLPRCLDSLLDQDIPHDHYEIIIINDGSEGNCKEIVHHYQSKYPLIKYFEQANQGLFQTRNNGADLAVGKYLYTIDSDDYLATKILGPILFFMQEERLDIFGFDMVKTESSSFDFPQVTKAVLEALPIYDGQTYLSKFDYRKESVWFVADKNYLMENNIRYQKGIGFSDGLFSTASLLHAKRIAETPYRLYAYFQHPKSILNNTSPDHLRRLLKRYEATTDDFTRFRHELEEKNVNVALPVMKRIRSKEVSYIFFMLIRIVRSNLSFREIDEILGRLKSKNIYPIRDFEIPENNRAIYRVLIFIVNHKVLFYPAIFIFRSFQGFLRLFQISR